MKFPEDAVVDVVHNQFDALPQKRKPQLRSDHVRAWVPLCGIVMEGKESLRTGMKCLPQSKISQAQGVVLHDWHAEIVAIRSFNNFLLHECQALVSSKSQSTSGLLRRREASEMTRSHSQPFTINEDIRIHMYCSEAPCGDASMELTIAAQKDNTPWTLEREAQFGPSFTTSMSLQGRAYFSHLGIVRRKPSRPDAPPTLSKSCSDKLSQKQVLSLLSSLLSLFISPENAYLSSLIIPSSQNSPEACSRAFGPNGRMAALKDKRWESGYRMHCFQVLTTGLEFCYSRRVVGSSHSLDADKELKLVSSNNAAAWTPYGEETLIGGVLQGRKQFDTRGASMLSKKIMWKFAREVAAAIGIPAISEALSQDTYREFKDSDLLESRKVVKRKSREDALKMWERNLGGDEFSLDRSNYV